MRKRSSYKSIRRKKIQIGIRRKISGTSDVPRLSVFRSNRGIYAQLIDDISSTTLVSASFKDKDFNATGVKSEISKQVGLLLAQKAKKLNIEDVVFDRSGYLYHGNVKSLAEGAREGGLKF